MIVRKNNVGHISIFTVLFIIYVSIISIFCNIQKLKSLDSVGITGGCYYFFDSDTGRLVVNKTDSGNGKIPEDAFRNKSEIKEVIIESGVTAMGEYVFRECANLESIEIPGTISVIPKDTCYTCDNLKLVIINEGVTSIETSAFKWCAKLKSVIIPSSIAKIDSETFIGCTSLRATVDINNTVYYSNDDGSILKKSDNSIVHQAPSRTELTSEMFSLSPSDLKFVYNGNKQVPTISGDLVENTDYKISYKKGSDVVESPEDAGNYQLIITGIGDYKGELTYDFLISKKTITKPAGDTTSFIYNGSEQIYNIPESSDYTVTGNKQTNAGTHTVTVSLNDKSNTVWSDNTLEDINFDFVISKKNIEKPTGDTTSFIYNGSEQTYNIPESNDYTVTGNKQTNAGTHTVTVSLNDKNNTVWSDNTSENINFDFVISKKNIEKPTENDIPESLSQAQPSDSVYPKGVENLVYDEEEHKLINPGEKYMGQMYYRIGIDGSWSSDIPVGTDSGSYDIYWYLDGGKDYESVGSRDNPNGPISVSISNWGKLVVNNGVKNYVDSNGMTSAQIFGDGVTWIKEESGGTYAWYGIDNSKRNFKDGSRFWVRWLSKEENPNEWKDYYEKIDDEHKNSVKNDRLWIFLTGVTSPDGTEYKKLEDNNDFYIQLGSDWDEDDIVAMFVADDVDEKVNVSFLSDFSSPEGNRQFAKLILTHFSPYAVYDKITKTSVDSSNENVSSDAGEENQISPSYKKLSDKSYEIVNTGKNKILLPSSLAFFIVFSYLNFLKRKKIS